MRNATRTSGYTLVELLVVIAIIGILIGISVPAVQEVRARMRQTQCLENLRQVALAAANFESSKGHLPGYCQSYGIFAGGVDPTDPGSYGGNVPRHAKIGSWQVALLPELDKQPYYERWTLDRYPLMADGAGERLATNEGYSTIAAANLTVYQCPSATGSIAVHGLNNYVANTGMHADRFPMTYTRPGSGVQTVTFARSMSRNNGVFNNQYAGFDPANPTRLVPTGKKIRSSDFKDGQGNTMLFSENQQAEPWYLTRLTGNASHLTNFAMVSGKEVVAYPIESRYLQGSVWHFEDDYSFGGAATVRPIHKINGGDVYNTYMSLANASDVARPSSLHVGGVNMAMADGSVRYVVETIEYRVYQSFMTPNGRSSDMPNREYLTTTEL